MQFTQNCIFLHVCACVCHMYVCVCMQHEHMYVFCVCLQLFMMSLVTMWVKGTDHRVGNQVFHLNKLQIHSGLTSLMLLDRYVY